MSILWLRFSDETFPIGFLDKEALQKVECLWLEALQELGFTESPKAPYFSLIHQVPYVNFSLLLATVSEGALRVEPSDNGLFKTQLAGAWLPSLAKLVRLHFRLEASLTFRARAIVSPKVRSLALGVCQQIFLMRLPHHTYSSLASWLIDPRKAPLSARGTLRKVLTIQKERNAIAATWLGFFPESQESWQDAPEYFWASEEPRPTNERQIRESNVWEGLAVFPGEAEGSFSLINDTIALCNHRSILVFAQARPQHVMHYQFASALLFAHGGVLSHACSVAREMGIPCITGLGKDFWTAINAAPVGRLRVRVCAESGKGVVTLLATPFEKFP